MSAAGDLFVVDDNPENLRFLTGLLRDAGYGVRMAQSGRRALAAIELAPPELILLDVNMPDLSGYAVCEELKCAPRTRDIPVIFLSALDDVRDKVTGFRAGAVDYVTKPFQAEEVLARVETQLGLARLRLALAQKNQELERKNAELLEAWQNADRLFSTLSEVLPGMTLDRRWRLEEKIGAGGFAAVYRAIDLQTQTAVAVKVLRPQPGLEAEHLRQHFARERASLARLTHPNAIAVLDAGVTAKGIAFLVMELLEGRTLAEELRAERTLAPARCLELLAPICAVLGQAHAVGIIHRDVKPANIFLHRTGGAEVVKVVDFGIAKIGDPGEVDLATTVGRLLGTPVYMSPERLLGQPYDARADVYSLGMVLYEALTGRFPFDVTEGNLGGLIMTCVSAPPLSLAASSPTLAALDPVVMRAISRQPTRRPFVAELLAELTAAVAAAGAAAAIAAPPAAVPLRPIELTITRG